MPPRIERMRAREVLDSRGNPTVEVDVTLDDGSVGRAIVPSGASTGAAEAMELRDGDAGRYHGGGVLRAVGHVNKEIQDAVRGLDATGQARLDRILKELDGTSNKSRLGANALLGVSLGVARAAAASAGLPLYRYLGGAEAARLPVPMINILSGGMHGGGNIDFQDYQAIPLRAQTYSDSLRDVWLLYRAMRDVLKSRGVYTPGVADEGGFAPALKTNEQGFELMTEAIERAGFAPGEDMAIAVDVAASHFYANGRYAMAAEGAETDAKGMIERLSNWRRKYPILSVEDGLDENDWEGWKRLTKALGARTQLIGDDLFVTHLERLKQGITSGAANAILIKINQIGTLTETLDVIALAKKHGYRTVVSARSGETEDSNIADIAVATGAGQIKIGALTRSERLAKYNRLLRIEEQLGVRVIYQRSSVFRQFQD